MTDKTTLRHILWLSTLIAVPILAYYIAIRPESPPQAGQLATPTDPFAPNPIMTAADAVTQSLLILPPGAAPTMQSVKLLSQLTFEVWSSNGAGPLAVTPDPADFNWTGENPDNPIWLVGFLLDISAADILNVGAPAGLVSTETRMAHGAYYAWDANSGQLIEQGALIDSTGQTYASISGLSNHALTPKAATPWPTDKLETPLPTYTWSPEELATGIAHATALAGTDNPADQGRHPNDATSVPQSGSTPGSTVEPINGGAPPNVDIDFQLTGSPEIGRLLYATLDFSVPGYSAIVTSQGGPDVDVTALLIVPDHYTIHETSPPCDVCGTGSAGALRYEWDLTVTAGITETITVSLSPQTASGEEYVSFWVRDRYVTRIGDGFHYYVKIGDGVNPGSVTPHY